MECYWPDLTEEQVKARLGEIVRTRNWTRDPIGLMGCVAVPSDAMVLFLFRGPSVASIRECTERAGIPFDRIVETITIEEEQGSSSALGDSG